MRRGKSTVRRMAGAATVATAALWLVGAGPALAQVANPGDESHSRAEEMKPAPALPPESGRAGEGHAPRRPSYDEPPSEGGRQPPGGLVEEDRIGLYGEPRWTAHRRFPTTRIYVRPSGFFELEWWIRPEVPRHHGPTETLTEFEAELGLGHRLQLDFYLDAEKAGHADDFELAGEKVELRYALADWGVLPGNPALYVEYHAKRGGPDAAEVKLLLGGELARRWHWGMNAVFERCSSGRASSGARTRHRTSTSRRSSA